MQSQPVGAAELALQSRQTPVIADQTRSFGGAGLLALALVAVGAMVFVMRGGTDLLKQWRLIRKPPCAAPSPAHALSAHAARLSHAANGHAAACTAAAGVTPMDAKRPIVILLIALAWLAADLRHARDHAANRLRPAAQAGHRR